MNPQYLPPQQNNFNPSSNGFPPRPVNPSVPFTTANKTAPPTIGSPNPNIGSAIPPQTMSRDGVNQPPPLAGTPGYLPTGVPQRNGQQQFLTDNHQQQQLLGNPQQQAPGNPPQQQPNPGNAQQLQQPHLGNPSQQQPNLSNPQQLQQPHLGNPLQQQANLGNPQQLQQPHLGNAPQQHQPHLGNPQQLQQQQSNGRPPLGLQGPSFTPQPMGKQTGYMGMPNQFSGGIGSAPVQRVPPNGPPQGNLPPQNLGPQSNPLMPPQNLGPQSNPLMPPQYQTAGGAPPNLGPPKPPLQNNFPNQMGGMPHPEQLANQIQGMSLSGPARMAQGPPHMPLPGYNQQPTQRAPGYPPMQQGAGFNPASAYTQPSQQQKRLDPDQMPSPIQVIQDDQKARSGPFVTNQKGLVPPLVTTDFVVQDQGNSSPRFIRSTMYSVPITQDIMKQTAIPFSLVVSPMARLVEGEYPPPIVDFGEVGPVRCIRCKAYMCPYMQFIDSGRRFQCLFCRATTDVPAEYFQHLDHTGQRMDKYQRPELVLGTYEFVATADYCRNNTLPKPPAIVFVIDVSYNNIKSGLVNLLCARMKEIIKNLPIDQGQDKSLMKVGFITYNSSVHFYNIKGNLAAPQMMIVGDTQEMFMPLLDGFLCSPEESETVIDALMEQIPATFADTRETEIVLLPAILAGMEALKASETTGKLLVFHSSLPTAEAPGKLRNRDDRKLLGTEKEKTVLTPQTQAYNQLGQDCVAAGCSVDLFVFNNSYIDLATIGQVCRLTGGEVFKYTYFQADVDGDRLINDVIVDISRPIAFDGIMRVRTSTGVRPTDFYGHFFMSNTTDIELAAIDCDKGIAIEIKHDDKLSEEEGVYIQAALLYTSCSGQRRLRIMNLSLKTCSQMADLYRSCDLDTVINYVAKQATFKLYENHPKAVKDMLVNRAAQILATYRKHCASPSSAGQLILPECMKLLPLYVNCLWKNDAISGGSDMTLDDRAFAMQVILTLDVQSSVNFMYPRLIPLHELDLSDPVQMPAPIRCTHEKMSEQGVYILENGVHMFLWIGLGACPDFVQNVFGAASAIQIDIERPFLPELDNPLSVAVRRIIDDIRIERHRWMRLTIVRQREKLEPVFQHFLVEDRGTDGSASYVDFLCHMHKEIRGLLS